MEEIYREESTSSLERKVFAAIALLLIGCLFMYEWDTIQKTRHMSLLGVGIDCVLLVLWFWRISFKYTLVLYKEKQLEVITTGLGMKSSYFVDLTRAESFTDKYVKSFFRKTKISKYVHRYDSLDNNQQRLLVFTEGEKNKLTGLLFKCSDDFLKQLRKQIPDKYIQL